MKRLLTSLCFLVLATGCGQNTPFEIPNLPSDLPVPATTANLAGTVSQMTPDGAMPVEGALVELLQNTDSSVARAHKASRPSESFVLLTTVTNSDGRYEFTGLGFGTYSIHVSKAGFSLYDSGEFQLTGDLNLNADLKAEEEGSPSRTRARRRAQSARRIAATHGVALLTTLATPYDPQNTNGRTTR
jgi:protocatechuate 3,4-dioxygenase beta subunit